MTSDTPTAPRRPHAWTRPTGKVEDPYAWLLQKDDSETLTYLAEENSFCNQWFTNHTKEIEEIFLTIKSRIQEDDSSHPVSHANWWYTSRTEAGKSYAIHSRGRTAETATEKVLIDENVEAIGHDYFSLGAFEVSNNTNMNFFKTETENPMIGKRVKLIHMEDPEPIPAGTEGIIIGVDPVGYRMKWDNGRTLGLIPGEDRWEVLE